MTEVMVIQGRELHAEDIGLIRSLLAEHGDWRRTRISKEFCRRWDWRNGQGRFKGMAARTGRPVGYALFGSAARKCAARDAWIGWDQGRREANLGFLTNNTRFLVLPWVTVPHPQRSQPLPSRYGQGGVSLSAQPGLPAGVVRMIRYE